MVYCFRVCVVSPIYRDINFLQLNTTHQKTMRKQINDRPYFKQNVKAEHYIKIPFSEHPTSNAKAFQRHLNIV